jgi:hypothetical protein
MWLEQRDISNKCTTDERSS